MTTPCPANAASPWIIIGRTLEPSVSPRLTWRARTEPSTTMGKEKRIVMDGRDIGSVVFPKAQHKFFIIADVDVRVQRRHNELTTKGKTVSVQDVKENLEHRDHIDSTRKESPLTRTPNHILIDNSYLTRAEQLVIALKHIKAKNRTLVA